MIGQACQYRPEQHEMLHGDVENWIKRGIPDLKIRESLFVYRHRLHGTFVIGLWVGPGRFVDVLNMGHSLANFNREKAQQFIRQINDSVSGQQIAKILNQAERDRVGDSQQQADEIKKRRNEIANKKVLTGWTPNTKR